MSHAAYQRGSRALSAHLTRDQRPEIFRLMDDLNAAPKAPDAGTPFGPVIVYQARGVWVIECPVTGFGYWYPSLRACLYRWRVQLTAYDASTNRWAAHPLPAERN